MTAFALLTPGPQISRVGPPDWVAVAAHFVLFMVMTVLLERSLRGTGVRRPLAGALVLSILYGWALELAQVPIEGRHLENVDFIVDGLGGLTGAVWVGLARRSTRE